MELKITCIYTQKCFLNFVWKLSVTVHISKTLYGSYKPGAAERSKRLGGGRLGVGVGVNVGRCV